MIKGQALGTVGISDPALGSHLHFEIRRGGPAVDPAEWLRAAPDDSLRPRMRAPRLRSALTSRSRGGTGKRSRRAPNHRRDAMPDVHEAWQPLG